MLAYNTLLYKKYIKIFFVGNAAQFSDHLHNNNKVHVFSYKYYTADFDFCGTYRAALASVPHCSPLKKDMTEAIVSVAWALQ